MCIRDRYNEIGSGTTIGYYYCYNCGRPRSKSYHLNNAADADHALPGVCRRCLSSSTPPPVVGERVGGERMQHHISHGVTSRPRHHITLSEVSYDEEVPRMRRSSRDLSEVNIRIRSSDSYREDALVQRYIPTRITRVDLSDSMTSGHVPGTATYPSTLMRRGRNDNDGQISTRPIG